MVLQDEVRFYVDTFLEGSTNNQQGKAKGVQALGPIVPGYLSVYYKCQEAFGS